jgi:hypothetical protein
MSVKLFEAAVACSLVPSPYKAVLLGIAWKFNDDEGCAWPSYAYLARFGCVGRTTVYRAIDRYEACGVLTVERRSGPKKVNKYVLHLPPVPIGNRFPADTGSQWKPHRFPIGTGTGSQWKPKRQEDNVRHSRTRKPRARNARKAKTPDPRIGPLIDAFVTEHKARLGSDYLIAGGRDGAAFKRALTKYDEATIRSALPAYFADRQSIARIGADVPKFVGRIATLLATASNGTGPASSLPNFTALRLRRATRERTSCD